MLAGGALGGVAGNAVGGGTGRTIATVGGAILGALAGNAIENSVGKSSGYEITVRRTTAKPVSWPRKPMCPSASANASR